MSQTFSSELLQDGINCLNQPQPYLPIPTHPTTGTRSRITEIDPSNHTETEPNSQVTTSLVPMGNFDPRGIGLKGTPLYFQL